MSYKRPPSPTLISNPFVKKRNLVWALETPVLGSSDKQTQDSRAHESGPSSAAVEAGEATITDHLTHFSAALARHSLAGPLLSISDYQRLYSNNAHSRHGAHFVIHQHDHPVAGTHYDLRLQINETSSVSWAVMYGPPGDANSQRLNRNATETRIHCLWNHLVETASASTGSLIIWDTGTYAILPRTSKHAPESDPDSQDSDTSTSSYGAAPQQALLHQAFQDRKIRLQLHGAKLPRPYVLNLRLTKSEDAQGRARAGRTPKFRRQRGRPATGQKQREEKRETTASEESDDDDGDDDDDGTVSAAADHGPEAKSAVERELRELEDEDVRRTNAYPGASNTIGSVHQRRWYLSMDRPASGFVKKGRRWVRSDSGTNDERHSTPPHGTLTRAQSVEEQNGGCAEPRLQYPFHVRGADVETSVVTGRLGRDVLRDEKVTGFKQRKGWKPVLD